MTLSGGSGTRAAHSLAGDGPTAVFRQTDPAQAVFVALGLSILYESNFGDRAAAQGWASRAVRIASEVGDPVVAAWASLARAVCTDDPTRVAGWSEAAYDVAASVGDRDLELCALSLLGVGLIDQGQVLEGMALLDEALAGALGGEGARPDTVVFTSCLLMQSCVQSGDFLRVVQWTRSLDSFIERYGCPYLHATCRASYGAVLVSTGDWPRAEHELTAATELARPRCPPSRPRRRRSWPSSDWGRGGLARHVVCWPASRTAPSYSLCWQRRTWPRGRLRLRCRLVRTSARADDSTGRGAAT